MIQLYVKTGCPFCEKALAVVEKYNIPIEEKNIADEGILKELLEKGGKQQTPFIVDGEVQMYESDDIVAYLEEKYGDGKPAVRVHVSNVSPVCPSTPDEKKEEE